MCPYIFVQLHVFLFWPCEWQILAKKIKIKTAYKNMFMSNLR